MKIGLVTDSLAQHSLSALLTVAAEIGIERLEFTTGPGGPRRTSTSPRCSRAAPGDATSWP